MSSWSLRKAREVPSVSSDLQKAGDDPTDPEEGEVTKSLASEITKGLVQGAVVEDKLDVSAYYAWGDDALTLAFRVDASSDGSSFASRHERLTMRSRSTTVWRVQCFRRSTVIRMSIQNA